MFNIVFCDDNEQFLASIIAFMQGECNKYVLQGEEILLGPRLGNGEEAINYIMHHHVDVLFLDIDMPKLGGFDVARIIVKEYPHIKIIFMSAYDNFVYSSFDYYPFAYLRKKHISEELPNVIKRLVEKMYDSTKKLMLMTTTGVKTIDASMITYAESNKNYYIVHMLQGRQYECRGTLTALENDVMDGTFFRVHSAYLVNFEHIERILGNCRLQVKDATIPIAQKRMQEFRQAYMEYIRRCFNT